VVCRSINGGWPAPEVAPGIGCGDAIGFPGGPVADRWDATDVAAVEMRDSTGVDTVDEVVSRF
jgi:hypothetical protein